MLKFSSSNARLLATLLASAVLAGCGSVGAGVGFSVPIFRGVSIGVGVGSGGVNAGVSAGSGPVAVGVGVNQNGQVTGGAGVGVGTEVGNSGVRAGVGVGTGTVLYDPNEKKQKEQAAGR